MVEVKFSRQNLEVLGRWIPKTFQDFIFDYQQQI